MANLLLGKPVIDGLKADLTERVSRLRAAGTQPTLAILRVGERPDDLSYERTALKRAEGLGIQVQQVVLPERCTQAQLEEAIRDINADQGVHGCLMFRPLPRHLLEDQACQLLDPAKDVDGIGRGAMASVYAGSGAGFAPCTAAACMEMLDHYGISLAGKNVVVVGRSLVIGKPAAMLALSRNATVTVAHSRTANLPKVTSGADVVILATGRAKAYGAEYFRPGQVVLDVGINTDDQGNLCGDADFDAACEALGNLGSITPVPRGVGGVTTSVLMKHVVEAAEADAAQQSVLAG